MSIQVLIVDDEEKVARSVSRLLKSEGIKVFTANSGQEGLDALRTDAISPHVVISDQRMPKMSGADFLSIVAKEFPLVKRILLTGYTDLEPLRTAVNKGQIYRFLLKPWDDNELLMCVNDAYKSYKIEQDNIRLTEELTELNQTLERKVEEKTRVLKMNISSLERYEDIMENMPIGVLCVSDEGMIVLANQQARIYLSSDSALEGRFLHETLPDILVELLTNFSPDTSEKLTIKNMPVIVNTSNIEVTGKIAGKLLTFQEAS